MSPLYIKMRPEDNVTVDMLDLTDSESLIMLDYASYSRTDSSAKVALHKTDPEHDSDDDTQPVCDSLQPSSSNELCDNKVVSDEMCRPEISVESTKTQLITDTSDPEIKYSDIIDQCDTSQIVNSECAELNVPQNITASRVQSPDSSTTVDWLTKLPDNLQKSVLNKEKKPKRKSKFLVSNFVKSPKKSSVVKEIPELSNIAENTSSSNADSEKETRNFKTRATKSKRKVKKTQNPEEPNTGENESKLLPHKEQKLEERRKKTKLVSKPKMNLAKNEDTVSAESRTKHTEEKSSLEDVEHPEDTRMSKSKRKSTSKLKRKTNTVESDEPIESAVPVNVKNATDKKNTKKKNRRTKQKTTEPKWKIKWKNRDSTKASINYLFGNTSDDEEISGESKLPTQSSTSEPSSKSDDVPKKIDKKDRQKDCDNKQGKHSGKTVSKKNRKLQENRQTTAPTEHCVVQSKSKLADKKQSSELERVETKLPTRPVTIKPEKLKCIPKLFKKCRANSENKEQLVQPAFSHVKLLKNWNMPPLSPISQTTESLPKRWAETGLIEPLNENFYIELERRRLEFNLEEPLETFSHYNQNSNSPISESSSGLGEPEQFESRLAVSGITKLPVKEDMKSHETMQPSRQISKETTTPHEHLVAERITTANCAMQPREVNLPSPFLVPSAPPRKRSRTNTNIEQQTLPLKTNIDSCEADADDKEIQNASDKHSFNFVEITATPSGTRRIQKIKITRPDMSDIARSNVMRKPVEDDSISIYAESLRTETMSVSNDCDLEDRDNETSSYNNVNEWIRHTRGHTTDNAEETVRPLKYPKINYNMFGEDEASTGVVDTVEMTEQTTMRSSNVDTLYLFDDICPAVLQYGNCKKRNCGYKHTQPRDWEFTLQNMPKESLRNLYNNMKNRMYLYMFKKMFPIVAEQFVEHRDLNGVMCLVKDALEINMDANRTRYIHVIIDVMCSIGMTLKSVINVIFNSTLVTGNLKDQLTDILINICMDRGDIANIWSTVQVLMEHRNYHVDANVIQTILNKCLIQNKFQKELCLKVYWDLIYRILDDKLWSRFECLLNDYIKCMRTLGLMNEAQMLSERIAALSVQSARSSVSLRSKVVSVTRPKVPLFNVKLPGPPKPSPPSTFTQKDNSLPHFNAPYKRPIVLPCNSKGNSLKDVLAEESSNRPSTSATVAPYVEEVHTYRVKQAIFMKNLSLLLSLLLEYKEGDLTDEFLKTCLDAIQESAHNFAVLFGNLSQTVTDYQSQQDLETDKSFEHILQTIGYNLIIYSIGNDKWEEAYNIYQTLLDLYSDSDITKIKLFMANPPSYIKRLLIICEILVKHNDCGHAWELFKVNSLHTSHRWTGEADQQDIRCRDRVFTELMTSLQGGKQWEMLFTIVEYILKNNINELDPVLDTTIQRAVGNDCIEEYIISLMSTCPGWYRRVHCYTFRVIVVKLVRDQMYRMARSVYRLGCEINIYPALRGNEKCLIFSTHYVPEEILLMFKVFLHSMINFMPIRHAVVIKVHESAEPTDETGTELPSLLQQCKVSFNAMHVRIVNILNNQIKPPIRVVNKYSQLEITPAELQNHLEVRKKWNKFC